MIIDFGFIVIDSRVSALMTATTIELSRARRSNILKISRGNSAIGNAFTASSTIPHHLRIKHSTEQLVVLVRDANT